jgi:HD superfamily phosphohydrolase
MKLPYDDVHLIADPLYGYLRITLSRAGEIAEADVIDNPWVQRLKRIHQLQSSWWVFPTAEHSRFAHSLGAMHLAGQLARQVYPTLCEVEAATPSLPLVEETLRLAGLLHDLGHGPFSHFCDAQYFSPVFGIDHEQISQYLIVNELGGLLAELRRSPSGTFEPDEAVDPWHVAFLVRAEEGPGGVAGPGSDAGPIPRWVRLLHRALSGAVTVDNMDYVRRDAYMCGVALGPVDVDRLVYYAFCTEDGLTFHKRALSALRAFLNARFYMYENVYFHRVGHAIDLHLHEIFRPTMAFVLPNSPLDDLAAYRRLTEWSLFTTVEDWLDEHARGVPRGHRAPAAEGAPAPRLRRRHRLPGPPPAEPAGRAQAHRRVRPRHRPHRGAAAGRHPGVRAGQSPPVPRVRGGPPVRARAGPGGPRRARRGGAAQPHQSLRATPGRTVPCRPYCGVPAARRRACHTAVPAAAGLTPARGGSSPPGAPRRRTARP